MKTRRRTTRYAPLAIAACLLGVARASESPDDREYGNPERFESAIGAFEAKDREQQQPSGAVVCIGSSSIRAWHATISEDLAPVTVIPRGFGGSNMNDALHFADRIVMPYKPRAVVIYEGDNDIAQGIAPKEIAATFGALVARIHKQLPEARIYFLSIKPSIRRWELWPQMTEANRLIAELCAKDKLLTYVDVASGMLDADGKPRNDIFLGDNLHMNRKGYLIWRDALRPILVKRELPSGPPPISLVGKDLSAWQGETGDWQIVGKVKTDPNDARKLASSPGAGVLLNGPTGRTRNIFSKAEHADVEAHIEFMVPLGSNSGIYFQGRYEIQILDSWGVTELKHGDCGGIYQRWAGGRGFEGHAPRTNASRPPGEWQTFDVVFRGPRFDASGKMTANARFVKVVHNGKVVHESTEVTGPTRAAGFGDEKPLGPLMIQGDHGPVALRNIRLRPIELNE